jgi:type IV secretory pathway VirB4 component
VLGQPNFGKSALSKSYQWRQRVFGRLGEFDPKGEYDALVTAMGGVVLRLEPGRGVRLSPLTRIGTREMREGLLNACGVRKLGRAHAAALYS